MPTSMIFQLLRQLFRKPLTNEFPVKHIPKSINGLLELVRSGKAKIHPPIKTPEGFRGKIQYDKERCIGCGLCLKVCPSKAIEMKEPEGKGAKKKIKIFVSRCLFCSQCNDICPVKALSMGDTFTLADYDKFSEALIVE